MTINLQPPEDYKSRKPEHLYGRAWTRSELTIALDRYMKNRNHPKSEISPFVKEISDLLGRTPASIVMRMENFSSLDHQETGRKRGLNKVGADCRSVFEEWHNDVKSLEKCANTLQSEILEKNVPTIFNATPVLIPKAFGDYELYERVGIGGYGEIFSCVHMKSSKMFAIKVIRSESFHSTEVRHRFVREIKSLRSVSNDHVIRIYDDNLETEDGYPAFVMELAEDNLNEFRISKGKESRFGKKNLSTKESLAVMRSVIKAVECLHNHPRKIIHRDINPCNILRMPDGRWVLADFGLSKFVERIPMSKSFSTETKIGAGTHYFAAPEQWRDLSLCDERTDIYALGVLLWELFSAHGAPHDRNDSGLDQHFHFVQHRATEREPANRFQTLEDFSQAFEEAVLSSAS